MRQFHATKIILFAIIVSTPATKVDKIKKTSLACQSIPSQQQAGSSYLQRGATRFPFRCFHERTRSGSLSLVSDERMYDGAVNRKPRDIFFGHDASVTISIQYWTRQRRRQLQQQQQQQQATNRPIGPLIDTETHYKFRFTEDCADCR
jgi:hypothetical protein